MHAPLPPSLTPTKLINEEEEKFAEWDRSGGATSTRQIARWELGNYVLPAEEEDQRGFKQGDVRKDCT
uniref:Uncharacterized protein n=1 Tax=Caenorhabditis japonica TaxID=281687 RepID=A0A8R1IQT6_CAEJA